MNMDATIDGLVDTCERNWVEKQALGPVGSKLTASALLALAGGAAGAGAGFMFDRGRVDPDESPSARARKMKQRMLRGAGIGAAAGGLGGMLLAAPGPAPIEPHNRAEAIRNAVEPSMTGGAQQEAIIREMAGLPVRTGWATAGRVITDTLPVVGADMNPYAEVSGTLALPTLVWALRHRAAYNGGAKNFWRGAQMPFAEDSLVGGNLRQAANTIHLPRSDNYAKIVGEGAGLVRPGTTPAAVQQSVRTEILQGIVSRIRAAKEKPVLTPPGSGYVNAQGGRATAAMEPGNLPVLRSNVRSEQAWRTPREGGRRGRNNMVLPGDTRVPGNGTKRMMQVGTTPPPIGDEAALMRELPPALAARLRAGKLGPTYRDRAYGLAERVVNRYSSRGSHPNKLQTTIRNARARHGGGSVRDIVDATMRRRGYGPAYDFHAGIVLGQRVNGAAARRLKLTGRMALVGLLSNLLTQGVNNVISNSRVRGMAKDVADKLVA